MYRNAPSAYLCPFCVVALGQENEHVLTRQGDIVYRDGDLTAFICSHQFEKNAGHVLVIPNTHYENIYELPDQLGHSIHTLARMLAVAMKAAYRCDGLTIWQSNEPAGTQTVWHYHLHVIPRFVADDYFRSLGDVEHTHRLMEPGRRAAYAHRLRRCLHAWPSADDGRGALSRHSPQ